MEDLGSAREEHPPTYLVLHAVKGNFDGGNGRDCRRLDGRLWSRLPEELVGRVLLFLPLGCQLRFRSVSKRWFAILSSSRFFIRSATVRPLPMFCVSKVMSGRHEIMSFSKPRDTNRASKAYCLDMSYLPVQFDWDDPEVTLQDGLICLRSSRWQSETGTDEQFCLVNPFTKAWKQLPNLLLPEEDQEVWSVMVQTEVPTDGGKCGFNVSVLVEIREMLDFVAVYSSATDSWQTTSCAAWPVAVPFDSSQHVVTSGRFCTYAAEHLTLHSLEDGKMVQHAKVPAPASSYHLLGYDGDIFLAGQSDLIYGIWRLKVSEMRWEQMASVPESWMLDLTTSIAESEGQGPLWSEVKVDGLINGFREGSFICMVIRFSSLLNACSPDRLQVIGFDILDSTWHVFPEHDLYHVCPCYLEPKLHLNNCTLALVAGPEGLQDDPLPG